MLTSSAVFAVIITSILIQLICMFMHVHDSFASFPGLWLWHSYGLTGEYGFVQPFEGILTCSDLFVGSCKLFTTLCTM